MTCDEIDFGGVVYKLRTCVGCNGSRIVATYTHEGRGERLIVERHTMETGAFSWYVRLYAGGILPVRGVGVRGSTLIEAIEGLAQALER